MHRAHRHESHRHAENKVLHLTPCFDKHTKIFCKLRGNPHPFSVTKPKQDCLPMCIKDVYLLEDGDTKPLQLHGYS